MNARRLYDPVLMLSYFIERVVNGPYLIIGNILIHEGLESPFNFVEPDGSAAFNIEYLEPVLHVFAVKLFKEGLEEAQLLDEVFDFLLMAIGQGFDFFVRMGVFD